MNNEPGIKTTEAIEVAARLQENIKWLPVMIDDEVYESDIENMEKWIDLLNRYVRQQKEWEEWEARCD